MFTRYWRTYPWFLQLFLFAMMIFTFLGLSALIIYSLPKFSGFTVGDVLSLNKNSSPANVQMAVWVQGIAHLFTFAIPCFLFAYLTHPKPAQYLGLQAPKNALHWLLVPLVMVGLMLVILYSETYVATHITLSQSLQKQQERNNAQMAGLLRLKGTANLILLILIMAVVPAFGEEFMFRGLFLRFAYKRSRKMLFPVLISAFFFMMVHENPLGMPFIFLAGVVLALIYWLTGSLWMSILAHFLFNGIQVAIAYFQNIAGEGDPATDPSLPPIWVPIAGLILFLGAGYALIKTKRPLPPDWSDDFRGEHHDNNTPSSPFSLS